MRRREFITLLGGTTVAWPLTAGAQQRAMAVIGILDSDVANAVPAFRGGLNETGYVEGRDVAIELRSTAHNERLSALAADLVQKHVDVIAAIGGPSAPAALIGGDPVANKAKYEDLIIALQPSMFSWNPSVTTSDRDMTPQLLR